MTECTRCTCPDCARTGDPVSPLAHLKPEPSPALKKAEERLNKAQAAWDRQRDAWGAKEHARRVLERRLGDPYVTPTRAERRELSALEAAAKAEKARLDEIGEDVVIARRAYLEANEANIRRMIASW